MRLQDLVGHTAQAQLLKRLVVRDRLPHALLFEGIAGCGRRTVTLALAQALLCHQPLAGDACGQCDACRLVVSGTHPDCMVLPHDSLVADIPLDLIREQVAEQAFTSPLMGNRRVFVIPGIERLSSAGANSLLKVLEEPPKGTFILMTTSGAAGVLSTIRSRAQLYRLSPLSTDAIAIILTNKGMDAAQAQTFAVAARGSLRGIESDDGQAPIAEMETLCRDGLQMDIAATVFGMLPQKLTDEMSGKTLASEQRRILSTWLDILLQRLRQTLSGQSADDVEATCVAIERIFRLQHDLQRHISPQVVIEGLALAAR